MKPILIIIALFIALNAAAQPAIDSTVTLGDVKITSRKPPFKFLPGKTVVNVEANTGNAGANILEVLERSPGVAVGRDGQLILKGKPGVLVLVDGKRIPLAGAELQQYLAGLNAADIESIELLDAPPAKYDAAGNAGVINIRTKKLKQSGFNGNVNISQAQGRLPKHNSSIALNYRKKKTGYFLNYSLNRSRNFTDVDALRYYYENGAIVNTLDQPFFHRNVGNTQNARIGFDHALNAKTSIGGHLSAVILTRDNNGLSVADWALPGQSTDSIINTTSASSTRYRQLGFNLNAIHQFSRDQELSVSADYLHYRIRTRQYFLNERLGSSPFTEQNQGDIPTILKVYSAQADHTLRVQDFTIASGLKYYSVDTDNEANYFLNEGAGWTKDVGKSNHFLYREHIAAAYTGIEGKYRRISLDAGLRYELTAYRARQMAISNGQDSLMRRDYGSLFPNVRVGYDLDSLNTISVRVGRRIDRPPFQQLNPFTFIINKYTFQQGNPYILPQYTWNLSVTHQYKDLLTTTISYDAINDYFSQIFIEDPATGVIVYTNGNVGRFRTLGASVSLQKQIAKWWSHTMQVNYNYKDIRGRLWADYRAHIHQVQLSMNNQFSFNRGWGAEVSGFYISRAQNDLQEVLDPTGQLVLGVSKVVLKKKGTLRLVLRDVFYTQQMAGWTYFQSVTEWFRIQRDSRVAALSFSYRFGTAGKRARTGKAPTDVTDRIGNGQ